VSRPPEGDRSVGSLHSQTVCEAHSGQSQERINPPYATVYSRPGSSRGVAAAGKDLTVLLTTPLRLGARLLAGKAICCRRPPVPSGAWGVCRPRPPTLSPPASRGVCSDPVRPVKSYSRLGYGQVLPAFIAGRPLGVYGFNPYTTGSRGG
jgi:hypothetical protein